MNRTIYLNPCPQPRTPSGFEVFTPHERAARALKVPPQTLEGLALRILGESKLSAVPATAAGRILRSACRDVFDAPDADAAARGFKLPVQTLLRTNADLTLLAKVGAGRVQSLARVTANYCARLQRKNLVDQSEVLWRASERSPARKRVHVYGYFRPRVDELAFVDAVAGDGSEFILPCDAHPVFSENREAVEFLRQRGWRVENDSSAPATVGERLAADFAAGSPAGQGISAFAYPHVEAEVRGTLAQIKRLIISGTRPDEIALVARDDAFYGPFVTAVAWEYSLPIRALYAIPLSDTRVGAWVGLLLEAVLNDLPFEATARLLAQPIGPGLPDKQWAAVRARHPSGLARWQALGIDLSPLSSLPREDMRSRWVEYLQGLLEGFDIGGRVGYWSREVLAYHTLMGELAALAHLPPEVLTREEFAAELRELLSLETVPAQPGSGGVELHTPLSLFGTRHAHLFVMGMAEGVLPSPATEDNVLDFRERRKLAEMGFEFETAADAARREALSFFALLQTGTENICLSYPLTIQNRETIPSPYLARMGVGVAEAPPATLVASPEELRRILLRQQGGPDDSILECARRAYEVERVREGTDPHDEYDGVTGVPFDFVNHVWSVSQLTTLGQCPFSWFSRHLLKLVEGDEAEDALNAAVRGNLYHKVLEAALKVATRSADGTQAGPLRERILDALEGAFSRVEREMSLIILPAWDAQRGEHLAVLKRAVAGADFIRNGAVVLASERKVEGEWNGLKVKGVIDRVDRVSEGLVLVDYKSGASLTPGPKDADGKTRLDIQLPLYAHIVSASLFGGEPVADAYYYSLSKSKIIKKSAVVNPAQFEAFVGGLKTYLRDGSFPVKPDVERYACAYCAYDLVCRKGSRLERKGAAQ